MTTAKPLTLDRIAEIRARADAATPEPWIADDAGDGYWGVFKDDTGGEVARIFCCKDTSEHHAANATFIANARSDIPDLLASHDAKSSRIAELEKALQWIAETKKLKHAGQWLETDESFYKRLQSHAAQALSTTPEDKDNG